MRSKSISQLKMSIATGESIMSIHRFGSLFAVSLLLFSGSAIAQGGSACPAGTVCAADPQTVVKAMQEAGFRAKLGALKTSGNPMIESAAAGYDFEVHFNNCTVTKDCKSLMFIISFNNDDGGNTIELANMWNDGHRFSTMALDSEKQLNVNYDVTTAGGLSKENMSSVLDWWSNVLGDLRTFFSENPAPKKK